MTVCIAAACRWHYDQLVAGDEQDPGYAVVTATDLMMTDEGLGIEYEHTVRKSMALTPNCTILVSGNIALHSGVLLRNEFPVGPDLSPYDLANSYAQSYRNHIAEEAAQFYLGPFKLTLDQFLASQNEMEAGTAKDLNDKLGSYADYLKTDALIVGAVRQRAYIAYMNKYGILSFQDNIGFAAIGMGGDHAIGYLTQTRHSRTDWLYDVIWRIYCAKRRAEIAPGVGGATSMQVVTAHKTYNLEGHVIEAMRERYDKLIDAWRADDRAAAMMVRDAALDAPELIEDQVNAEGGGSVHNASDIEAGAGEQTESEKGKAASKGRDGDGGPETKAQ